MLFPTNTHTHTRKHPQPVMVTMSSYTARNQTHTITRIQRKDQDDMQQHLIFHSFPAPSSLAPRKHGHHTLTHANRKVVLEGGAWSIEASNHVNTHTHAHAHSHTDPKQRARNRSVNNNIRKQSHGKTHTPHTRKTSKGHETES